jgi:hypothetical protein
MDETSPVFKVSEDPGNEITVGHTIPYGLYHSLPLPDWPDFPSTIAYGSMYVELLQDSFRKNLHEAIALADRKRVHSLFRSN